MKLLKKILLYLLFYMPVSAQVTGTITDITGEPVVGANVFWLGTTQGTTSDAEGNLQYSKTRLPPPVGGHLYRL